jgi:ribosomal protein S18 acetylase RimI-like enzyme
MTTTTDRHDFRRAAAMERDQLAAAAQRAEPHPLGLMLFDDARARVWVHNQLYVTGPAGDIDDLIGILDERYGHLEHRRAVVVDEAEGERLAEGFRDRGWAADTTVFMALRAPRDRDPDPGLAAEVSVAEHRAIERRVMAQGPFTRDPEVREMLIAARAARQAIVDEGRYVAGVLDGGHVGNTTVYVVGDIAQIEDVATLESFRGRGVARAMVSLAIDLARESDPGLIWIAADDNDWPKHLYAKLGFRPIGRLFSFTRTGGTVPPVRELGGQSPQSG